MCPAGLCRSIFAACFDSARGETLIYGGEVSTGRVYQLWGFNGTNWSQKTPSGATPVTANTPLLTFDSSRNVAVLLGGDSQAIPVPFPGAAVWEWDGLIWHERPQSGQVFGGTSAENVLAFDTLREESVLYGYVFGTIDGVSSSSYPSSQGYRFVWRWNVPAMAGRSTDSDFWRPGLATLFVHVLRHPAQRLRALRRTGQ